MPDVRRRGGATGRSAGAFTLLEVLMALALIAIVAAAAAPLLLDALGRSDADDAAAATEEAVRALQAKAVESGNSQMARITARGIRPGPDLPEGWKLEVRRLTETRFRKPAEEEFWEFNNAGISEPLAFRLAKGTESVEIRFDPLTGLPLDE